MEMIDIYNKVTPNDRQKIIQDMKFYAFVHFTVNTFTGKEWGNGKEGPELFNPTQLNTDQWCEAIASAGMKGVIITAKHHDGFCLWQTATTEHSIKNSPYKDGKGDIVAELAKSAKKYRLKLGVYLSPWDRNSVYYSTNKYMDFYIEQLRELLGNYGEIFMLWLDGACGSQMDGKPAQVYDFPRIYKTALELQPNIVMSGCAPDVRWVGNESGIARQSEWNVVPKFQPELQNLSQNCQADDDLKKFQKRCQDVMLEDMGSRKFLSKFDEFMWYPAEVDVSIRAGWFYHKREDKHIRSLDNLMNIYYNSVGGNSLFLLNIPPDKRGLFHENDVKRLAELGNEIKKQDKLKLKGESIKFSSSVSSKASYEIENLSFGKTFSPVRESETYEIIAEFEKASIDRIYIEEDTNYSQRIESFKVFAEVKGEEQLMVCGTVVGFGKIAIFTQAVETSKIKLVITNCRREPYIKKLEVFNSGGYRCKKGFSLMDKIKKFFMQLFT